ncbi:MAG: hypothetical protein ACPG19_01710 [Saprospiraceae bacterium]
MKKYLPFLLLVFFFLNALKSSAQVLPAELRKFRIYKKKNKPVKKIYKQSRISLQGENEYSEALRKSDNETFECYAEIGDLTSLQIRKGRNVMNIHAYFSLLDLPFRKGNYVIPKEYGMLFMNIQPAKGIKIINQNLQNFEVETLPKGQIYHPNKTYIPDTLEPTSCIFWQKDYWGKLVKIKEQNLPHYAKGFYEDKVSGTFYLWNDGNGYVSMDRGRNWELIPLPEKMIDSLYQNRIIDRGYMNDETAFSTTQKFYPLLKKKDRNKVLYKVSKSKKREEILLTLTDSWYAQFSVSGDIWCISAQGYMLVSRDEGKSWKYYVGDNYNVDVFEIIDGKYFFDGLRLYWIPEK